MATTIRRAKRRKLRLQERIVAPRKPADPVSKLVNIVEYAGNRGGTLKVDREQGIISGVKILGLKSRNGREYLPAAVAKAAPLYEGAKVNLNHPAGQATDPRDYQDRMGKLFNVAVDHEGGLSGNFRFNPKHALAEQLCWDAENAPENVGLSHNVSAKTRMDGNLLIVEEITAVTSVDLVADPGSTKSLFEYDSGQGSAARMPDSNMPPLAAHTTTPMDAPAPGHIREDDPDTEASPDPKQAMHDSICAKIASLCEDPDADPVETAATVKKLLQARAKMKDQMDAALNDEDDDEGDDDGEDAEEHLRRIQKKGTRTVTEQNELNKVKAELDAFKRKDSARKLLETANLPPLLCDDLLIEELANADTAKQKKLIDRQLLLAEQLRIQKPRSRDDSMQEDFDPTAARRGPPKTCKELLECVVAIDN